jgi:hypothetical protein
VKTIGRAYYEYASSQLSTFDSMTVAMQQSARSVSRGFTITSEGMRAAYTASEVNKIQKKAVAKAVKEQSGKSHASNSNLNSEAPSEKPVEGGSSSPAAESNHSTSNRNNETSDKSIEVKLSTEEEELLKAKMEKLTGHMFAVM